MGTNWRLQCAVGFSWLLFSTTALGQSGNHGACAQGQRDDRHGHCCWEGQMWSHGRHACTGTPVCPPGYAPQGDVCVPGSAAAAGPPPAAATVLAGGVAQSNLSQACAPGQLSTADTAGHCCWPGQVWSQIRQTCLGVPACPPGLQAVENACVRMACAPGQSITADTAGHCCWSGQVWSSSSGSCRGIPACPPGTAANGETCVVGYATQPLYPVGTVPMGAMPQPTGASAERETTHPLAWLGIVGVVTLGVTYLGAVAAGVAFGSQHSYCSAGEYLSAIPIAGGAVGGTALASCRDDYSFMGPAGDLDSLAQALGLTATIIGFAVRHTVTPGEQSRAPRWFVSPGLAVGRAPGISVGFVNF